MSNLKSVSIKHYQKVKCAHLHDQFFANEMDFEKKIVLFCVVIYATIYCSTGESDYPLGEVLGEACTVQYLKERGRLTESLESTVPPPSRCRLVIPFVVQFTTLFFQDGIAKDYPRNVADCLINELDKNEPFDYYLKADLIKWSSLFSSSEKSTQLKEANNQLDEVLKEITVKCKADESHTKIFNETWEDYQHDYCVAKYAIDNQLVELKKVDINPHHIDTNSFNCTKIVNIERSKTEKQYSDKMSATENGQRSLDCVINEFRNGNMFDWKVASTLIRKLEIRGQTYKISKKIEEFLSASTSACNL